MCRASAVEVELLRLIAYLLGRSSEAACTKVEWNGT